jgi:von Willebrand factor type A domain
MMKLTSLALLLVGVLCSGWLFCCQAGEAEFNVLVEKMERDVLEFGRAIESYHAKRCDFDTLTACSRANYHETLSAFPGQQCFTTGDLEIDVCRECSCGALWDYTTSTVRVPADQVAEGSADFYPQDPRAVEMICYSSFMDGYLREKKLADQSFWESYGVVSPHAYFGSATGAFRIFPGRTSPNGGAYDPRKRPWYVAASSGPKNVILILDTSGSMDEQNRMDKLKTAAKRIVSSLTVADRIAVVEYSSEARKIGRDSGKYVYTATKENIETLLREIDQLKAEGSTNTNDAFVKAFEILDDSYQQEFSVSCNTAILFLTDGVTTEPANLTRTQR